MLKNTFEMCLKKMIHQTDSKNEWMLLSACFMTKFELIFVLNKKALFLRGFILKPTERAKVLTKTDARD